MIRLPSLTYITEHARDTWRRFPYVLVCAFLGVAVAICLIEAESDDFWFTKILMTLALGIPLFFSLTIYRESPIPKFRSTSLHLLGAGGLLLVAFYFLSGQAATENFFLNYAQWALALHLLAAFSPFLRTGEPRGFWQFNRYLFLRFCLSSLYAGVFYIGMIIALGAVDHLLGITIHDKLYADIWVFSAGILLTWHFLAGVPKNLSALEKDDSYPGGLKIFTQYLLVPLVTLYLVILYLYLGKILIKADWPKGTVTWLVSVVSVAGVFNLLLLQPVQEMTGNKWIRAYAKAFYLALFPLVLMLFTSVGKRMGQYGVTEQRYFVTALGLWITGIALYFLLHKKPSIKTVPMTLFLITLLTSMGPWGAYSVSRASQMGRLKTIFIKDGLWNGTKTVKAVKEVPFDDRKEISSILDYLVENHGVAPLQPWFDLDLAQWKDARERSRYGYSSVSNQICRSLGFDHVDRWGNGQMASSFSYYADPDGEALSVKGYDWMVPMVASKKFTLEGRSYSLDSKEGILTLKGAGERDLVFDLSKIVAGLEDPKTAVQHEKVPPQKMQMEASNDHWEGRVCLRDLYGTRKDKGLKITSANGVLFLRRVR